MPPSSSRPHTHSAMPPQTYNTRKKWNAAGFSSRLGRYARQPRLPAGNSPAADLVRKDLKVRFAHLPGDAPSSFTAEYEMHSRAALRSARKVLLALRDSGEIGDDAFHTLENELDAMEVAEPLRAANVDATA